MISKKLVWERYMELNEVNLISVDPLQSELQSILDSKNVQKQEIKDWFLKTYIKWFKSPNEDSLKTDFTSPYEAKETDPEWAKKGGIFKFDSFTASYKSRLNHLIDYLNTKDTNYLKSLYKITVPNILKELESWDREMASSIEKSEKERLKVEKDKDYKIIGTFDGIDVWLLTSNKAFREESIFMGHCVGQSEGENKVCDLDENKQSLYYQRYLKGTLKIYSFRDPNKNYHPVATFSLINEQGSFVIDQMKGPRNGEVDEKYHKACQEFIEKFDLLISYESEDHENIGMIFWNKEWYFENSNEFNEIYKNEIVALQQRKIKEYLSKVKDGVIDGDVLLDDLFLKELPDFSNIKVNGRFSCERNRLKNLKGSPKTTEGFSCSYNSTLISLEGSPEEVITFYCSLTKIKDFKGCPKTFLNPDSEGGYSVLYATKINTLVSLQGLPEKMGNVYLRENRNLRSLEGGPKFANIFECTYCDLRTLKGAPIKVKRFTCNDNNLTSLEYIPAYINDRIVADGNRAYFTQEDLDREMLKSRERTQNVKMESFTVFFKK